MKDRIEICFALNTTGRACLLSMMDHYQGSKWERARYDVTVYLNVQSTCIASKPGDMCHKLVATRKVKKD